MVAPLGPVRTCRPGSSLEGLWLPVLGPGRGPWLVGKDGTRQDGGPGSLSASEPEPGSHLGLTVQCQQLWGATHWGLSQAVQVSSEKPPPPPDRAE